MPCDNLGHHQNPIANQFRSRQVSQLPNGRAGGQSHLSGRSRSFTAAGAGIFLIARSKAESLFDHVPAEADHLLVRGHEGEPVFPVAAPAFQVPAAGQFHVQEFVGTAPQADKNFPAPDYS